MTTLSYATLCSGIEAVSLAWDDLGMAPVFFADNASFPTRFLAHRFPDVPNLGDLLKIDGTRYAGKIDVLWASFPCQDFSEAGKGRGVDGARGALTLAGIRVVDEIDPKVFCFENVTGLLNDPKNAFGQFLGALCGEFGPLHPSGSGWTDAGYVLGPRRALAWRVLDAQHFRLPQQRRRVFLVACPRSGPDPREILFERLAQADAAAERPTGGTTADVGDDRGPYGPAYAVAIRGRRLPGGGPVNLSQIEQGGEVSNCLRASQGGSDKAFVLTRETGRWDVRALTPVECERLMGMPDDWSLIPGASVSQRLHAIGNSLAVPCVRLIGERIVQVMKSQKT